ncbi:MAG: hypothetical protein ACRDMZ_14640 [Solirubrobacteraceae bacterium]
MSAAAGSGDAQSPLGLRTLLRRRLAARLRRVVDWLDSPAPEPARDMIPVTRTELREIQTAGLTMIGDFARASGPDAGLVLFPREILQSIGWLVRTELATRDDDFAQNPRAAW